MGQHRSITTSHLPLPLRDPPKPPKLFSTLRVKTHRGRSDTINEFVILLMGQHTYDSNFS